MCLTDNAREHLIEHIARLREPVPRGHASWSRPENIHITLKFLGQIPAASTAKLSAAATRAVEGLSPFRVHIEKPGVFPKHGTPRVLWIGVRDDFGRLAELQTRLENECAKEGFSRETRAFHPHLTLARLRQPQRTRELALAHKELHFEPIEVIVSELLIMRSELSNPGSRYTVFSTHTLLAK